MHFLATIFFKKDMMEDSEVTDGHNGETFEFFTL